MKSIRIHSLAAILLVLQGITCYAGKGSHLPYTHLDQYRKANMVMLKFQDALAAAQWNEALTFCSDRVRKGAADWATPEEFFSDTMPLDKVLANCRFGFGPFQQEELLPSYRSHIALTPRDTTPYIEWYWYMIRTNDTWAIDWEPSAIDLDARIQQEREKIREREKRVDTALQEVEPKLRAVKTHLTPVTDRFVIGSPMLFRVELLNFGESAIHFTATGIEGYPLSVWDVNRQRIPVGHTWGQAMVRGGLVMVNAGQVMMHEGTLLPDSSEILGDAIDLTKDFNLVKPGTYFVQFDGAPLAIGAMVPNFDDLFGGGRDYVFFATPTKLPSNVIRIEIVPETQQ